MKSLERFWKNVKPQKVVEKSWKISFKHDFNAM